MTTYRLQSTLQSTLTHSRSRARAAEPRQAERLEAFFTSEAARGKVALRYMLIGSVVTVFFALAGYAVFGAGHQHQFFRDIGPVTALSTLEVFSVGFIGLLIASREQPRGGLGRWFNFWFLAGAGFLLLSLDSPLDLHGRAGHLIAGYTTVAEDIGFHATSDAILAVYMATGLGVAALHWREMLRYPLVLAQLMVGGLFIVASIGIDGFATHNSWMWILEEHIELLGLAWIVGAFSLRLNATQPQAATSTR